jgi:Reverse transcriptase (RNA-dependent DNA polymerase)
MYRVLPLRGPLSLLMLRSVHAQSERAHAHSLYRLHTRWYPPEGWRQGRVVNLFKAGDATLCGNYRPITLLPVHDKLFSSSLSTRLMQHVAGRVHVPLHDHQYAVWKNRGIHQPLFASASVIQARTHAGISTCAFFLDVKKAYDTVPHDARMYKLHRKGVQGNVYE